MKPPGTRSQFRNPWPPTTRIWSRTPAPIWDFLLPTDRGPQCGRVLTGEAAYVSTASRSPKTDTFFLAQTVHRWRRPAPAAGLPAIRCGNGGPWYGIEHPRTPSGLEFAPATRRTAGRGRGRSGGRAGRVPSGLSQSPTDRRGAGDHRPRSEADDGGRPRSGPGEDGRDPTEPHLLGAGGDRPLPPRPCRIRSRQSRGFALDDAAGVGGSDHGLHRPAKPRSLAARARPQIIAGFFGGQGGLHHERTDPAKPRGATRARGRNCRPLGVVPISGAICPRKPRWFASRARGRNWLSRIGT